MKNVRPLLSLITILFMSVSAFAHPGHGHHQEAPSTVMHYLSSPIHIISLMVVIGLMVYVAYRKGLLPMKPAAKRVEK